MPVEPTDVLRALRAGRATMDALAARTGGDRETLAWALEEATARGWVAGTGDDCGPDGLCGSSAPPVYSLTDAGRRAAAGTS